MESIMSREQSEKLWNEYPFKLMVGTNKNGIDQGYEILYMEDGKRCNIPINFILAHVEKAAEKFNVNIDDISLGFVLGKDGYYNHANFTKFFGDK